MSLRRAALASYRASLRLYPRDFRERFGDEMTALYEDLLEEHSAHGRWALLGFWLRALGAGLAGAARARLALATRSRAGSRGGARGGDDMLSTLATDVARAARALRRSPGFAAVAVLSLGLGMAANATMLTLVRALVWSRLPVPEPERLVRVFETDPRGPRNVSWPDYRDLREQGSDVFEGLLVHDLASFGLRAGERTEVIHGELVSEDYFDVLGLSPLAGRLFSGRDGAAGPLDDLPVVISHDLWQRRFGSDPTTIGRVVELSGQPVRIVGVTERSWNGTKLGLGMDLWVPLPAWSRAQGWRPLDESRGSHWLNAVGRLRPGVTLEDAQARASLVAARLAEQYPDSNRNRGFAVMSESAGNFGGQGQRLASTIGGTALAAAGLVLLVACGNVAALLLARAAGRRREMAVRQAIGASRGRLVGHFLAESLLIAAAATLVGLLLGRAASPLLLNALPPLPYRFVIGLAPDAFVLALMAAAGLATALACGLAPALSSSSRAQAPALMDGHGAPAAARLKPLRALAVLTLTVCCMALVLGGLFGRSLEAVRALDPGFETDGRATASADVSLAGKDAPAPVRYYEALLERLGGRDVRAAAVASNLPLTDRQSTRDVFDAARPPAPDDPGIEAWFAAVSESYFEVLGQPLLAGRGFVEADRNGPLVAVVSRRLAERLWPGEVAVGRRVRLGRSEVEVVGVAADAKYGSIAESARAALYVPFWKAATDRAEIVVRGRADDPALPERLTSAARAVDPRVPVFGAKALAVHLEGSLWMFRVGAGLAAATGLLAAALALAGLYGLMSYATRQGVREIGVRMALGASRESIVRLQLARGGRLAALGVALGLVAAAAGAGLMRSLIVAARDNPLGAPYDPLTFVAVGVGVLGLGVLACLPPALAAARTDPARSLRLD